MKKIFLVYILIYAVLLSIACKSKAPPRTVELPNTQSGSSSTGPSSSGSTSTPAVTQPSSPTLPGVTQPSGGVGTNIGSGNQSGFISGNQSGIILDGAVSYTVKKGDTLSGIARQFYQDGSYYPLIMMASTGISDIDKIYPNMKLTIPNLRANLNNATAKESINRYFLQIANIEDQRGRTRTAALIRNHAR